MRLPVNPSTELSADRSQAPPARRAPGQEPIPGYRLIELLGQGGFGEVWKCEAPGGLHKAIKFVEGNRNPFVNEADLAQQELQALECVKAIRHPFLLSTERVELQGDDLIIVMELADRSLHEVLLEHQATGAPGIPRDELLDYLLEAAEALDLMNLGHGLQHLDIKPRNLFVVWNHVKVADFGLVNSIRERHIKEAQSPGGSRDLGRCGGTPLYSAPEVLLGSLSPHSDQYSLAIVYQELLTGTFPLQGKNARQLMFQHFQAEPNLAPLPEADRPIVARALSKKPEDRYPSCLEFVHALLDVRHRPADASQARTTEVLRRTSRVRKMSALHRAAAAEDETPPGGRRPTPRPADVAPRHADTTAEYSSANAETQAPLPRMQYEDCIVRGPLGEVWTIQTPEGQPKLAYHLHGFAVDDSAEQARLLEQLAAVRHPALPPLEVVETGASRIILLAPRWEQTLADAVGECLKKGQEGMPREDALDWLGQAAQALDELRREHGLQHLGLHPGNLVIRGDSLALAEFGLPQLLWLGGQEALGAMNPRYAAPELFENRPVPASDQYSLALIYFDLVTGAAARQRSRAGARAPRGKPTCAADLTGISGRDRAVLFRALRTDPAKRFGSCLEFIEALEAATSSGAAAAAPEVVAAGAGDPERPVEIHSDLLEPQGCSSVEEASGVITAHLTQIFPDGPQLVKGKGFRYYLYPGKGLEHHCAARLMPGTARLRLDMFREKWGAEYLTKQPNSFVLFVKVSRSFWQRCFAVEVGLTIEVHLSEPQQAAANYTGVLIRIQPTGCGKGQATQLLSEAGPPMLESLRGCLNAVSEQRSEERLVFPHPVTIRLRGVANEAEALLECRGKDLSHTGIGLLVPCEPAARDIYVHLPPPPARRGTRPTQGVVIPARIVHVRPYGDGWYEVGAKFWGEKGKGEQGASAPRCFTATGG